MSKPVKVGILIVGGCVLFGLGLFLIGSSKQLFSHHYSIYAEFNNIDTIESGSTVRLSGMDAGTVDDVAIPASPSDKFRVKLKIDAKFRRLIREDSIASISTEGMVGNEFVQVKKGTNQSPECQPGCTIRSQEPSNMSQLMQQGTEIADQLKKTIKDLHGRADLVMGNISDLTGHADQTVRTISPNIQTMASNGAKITANANEVVATVRDGKGAAGKLLRDEKTEQEVSEIVSNSKQTTENVNNASAKANNMVAEIQRKDVPKVDQTMANVQDMTGQLNGAVGTFLSKGNNQESTPEALRDTVHHTDQASVNVAADTEALKHNFFLRGFFKRRGFYDLGQMTPSKYESSEFIKKPVGRVWISAAGLFETGPGSTQELAPDAPGILDGAMSGLVQYLPNNPVMVEGYSAAGPPAAQYASSEQRAEEARDYLESHFHLNSKWVGTIAFEDKPPEHTGKTNWDGISIVMIRSK